MTLAMSSDSLSLVDRGIKDGRESSNSRTYILDGGFRGMSGCTGKGHRPGAGLKYKHNAW